MSRDHFGNNPIVAGMGFSRGIMLLDDCEGTFNYTVTGTGGDDVHEYLAAAAFQGTYGLHLKTRTTAAADDDWLQITRSMSYPESGLLVARARLCIPDLTFVKQINFEIGICDGSNNYLANLVLKPSTAAAGYGNITNAFTAFTSITCPTLALQWFEVELVFDARAHHYVSALVNGTRESLAAVPVYAAGADTYRRSYFNLIITASALPPGEIYADNLYVGEYLEA